MSTVNIYYSYQTERKDEYRRVQQCAKDYLGLSIDLNILRDANGKPDFEYCCHFNISHSYGLWVCAIGPDPLGIDCEKIRGNDYLRVSDKTGIAHSDSSTFFRDWCRKESYVKYSGAGLKDIGKPVDESLIYTYIDIDSGYAVCLCTPKEVAVTVKCID